MPTYRLTVEYEGTRYRGWQEQKNARTVAGELRSAIEAALGEKIELAGSGRTDAGVHALAQVAHFKTKQKVRVADLLARLEEGLPADIQVLGIEPTSERFHARHSATLRSYVYQIARRRTALAKRFVWWVRRPLDLDAMRRAAAAAVGRHDFANFCEKPEEQTSTLVVVERLEIATEGDLLLIRIAASHFLWKMVRRLVGALVEVGAGSLSEAAFAALVSRRAATAAYVPSALSEIDQAGQEEEKPRFDRGAPRGSNPPRGQNASRGQRAAASARGGPQPKAALPAVATFAPAAHTAPPSGLFLERVLYPGEPPLGELTAAVPVDSPAKTLNRPSSE